MHIDNKLYRVFQLIIPYRNFENYFMLDMMMEMWNKKLILPYAYAGLLEHSTPGLQYLSHVI